MRKTITTLARVLLGLVFLASGIVELFQLVPPPDNLPLIMVAFRKGLEATGYFIPLLKITEIVCGILLITGVFVPLALVVLAPIVVNILMVHLFLHPAGLPIALVILVLELYLAFLAKPYSDVVKQLFRCPLLESKRRKRRV